MPWATRSIAYPVGDVTVLTYGSGGESIEPPTGSAPQWGDDSTATYARIVSVIGEAVLDGRQSALSDVGFPTGLTVDADSRLAVWVKADRISDPYQLDASISHGPSTNYRGSGTLQEGSSGELAAPPGWLVAEIVPTNGIENLVTLWRDFDQLYVEVTTDPTIQPPGTLRQEWVIYEARIVIYHEVAGVAPPCRLFPREDGLGVGGGRRFPPPRSQQRSGRRFGYY